MKERMIVALDYATEKEALAFVDQVGEGILFYKVGLELFLATQGSIISALKNRNKKIFLDLKFHDIPNTVAAAVKWATHLGVDMINVHALGGRQMMQTAQKVMRAEADDLGIKPPKLIAVTILTSFDEEQFQEVGLKGQRIDDEVMRLAELAYDCALDGVVCSPRESLLIHQKLPKDFITVCPGIRPAWADKGDQKRIMTPQEAILAGVNHMVIGRPITRADDPTVAAEKILTEIQAAQKGDGNDGK